MVSSVPFSILSSLSDELTALVVEHLFFRDNVLVAQGIPVACLLLRDDVSIGVPSANVVGEVFLLDRFSVRSSFGSHDIAL